MNIFRMGDDVRFEVVAKVEGSEDDMVLIHFDDTKMYVASAALTIVKRAIHQADRVMHRGRKARVIELLEENVFLVRVTGLVGIDGYVVASRDDLEHDDIPATPSDNATAPSIAPTPTPPAVTATPIPAAAPVAQPEPASHKTPEPSPISPAAVQADHDEQPAVNETAPRVPAEEAGAHESHAPEAAVSGASDPVATSQDTAPGETMQIEHEANGKAQGNSAQGLAAQDDAAQGHHEQGGDTAREADAEAQDMVKGDSVAEMGAAMANLIRRRRNLEDLGDTETIRALSLDGSQPE